MEALAELPFIGDQVGLLKPQPGRPQRTCRKTRRGEPSAGQIPVENLPDESLEFLLGSRYCEIDRLSDTRGHSLAVCRQRHTRFC